MTRKRLAVDESADDHETRPLERGRNERMILVRNDIPRDPGVFRMVVGAVQQGR